MSGCCRMSTDAGIHDQITQLLLNHRPDLVALWATYRNQPWLVHEFLEMHFPEVDWNSVLVMGTVHTLKEQLEIMPNANDRVFFQPEETEMQESYETAAAMRGEYDAGGPMQQFNTGATRSADDGKLHYKDYLSTRALRRYAEYMKRHETQADGVKRTPDNWKKGIPLKSYEDSLTRHFMAWLEALEADNRDDAMEAAEAMFFNVQGWMHETDKLDEADKTRTIAAIAQQQIRDELHASPAHDEAIFNPLPDQEDGWEAWPVGSTINTVGAEPPTVKGEWKETANFNPFNPYHRWKRVA